MPHARVHAGPAPHIDSLSPEKLGSAEHVGDVVLPGLAHKVIKFLGVANPGRTMAILLRGSNDLVLAEANRLIHDAQCREVAGDGASSHRWGGGRRDRGGALTASCRCR